MRFGRPHHFVDLKKHFKHKLKRRTDIDWDKIENKKSDKFKLKAVNDIKSKKLQRFYKNDKN